MKIAIIGAGLIGQKRAAAAKKIKTLSLAAVCDRDEKKARLLASRYGGKVFTDWKDVIARPDIEMVIVATPNSLLAPIGLAAVTVKKHVLLEKPGATRASDLRRILRAAKKNRVGVWIGYNHRFHPALQKSYALARAGRIGKIIYVRGIYGHGGRKGYEKEWRAKPWLSGGGELFDQGSHLIDLFQHFVGKPKLKFASLKNYFWDMPVEDNAFLAFESKAGQMGFFHASWTQWKNKFSFEIFGTKGALVASGLGGSYGPETLTFYRRPPQGGMPKEKSWSWKGPDQSFLLELKNFLRAFSNKKSLYRRCEEAIHNLEIIENAYHPLPSL